jgi:hypothetical protein
MLRFGRITQIMAMLGELFHIRETDLSGWIEPFRRCGGIGFFQPGDRVFLMMRGPGSQLI